MLQLYTGTKRKRDISETLDDSYANSPEIAEQSQQAASISASQRAHSSPPVLQSPTRRLSPDEDADLYVPLNFARRAVSAANIGAQTTAAGDSSSQGQATVHASVIHTSGLHTANSAFLPNNVSTLSHQSGGQAPSANLNTDSEVYDVPDDATHTKPTAR